jgi:hypothetical protein
VKGLHTRDVMHEPRVREFPSVREQDARPAAVWRLVDSARSVASMQPADWCINRDCVCVRESLPQ